MKETEQPLAKVEIREEAQQQKKIQFLGSLTPKPGHTCFQLNLTDWSITKATFEEQTVEFGKQDRLRSKLLVKPGYLYVTALNKVNAEKKFSKMLSARK
jgi:hypothetical protein